MTLWRPRALESWQLLSAMALVCGACGGQSVADRYTSHGGGMPNTGSAGSSAQGGAQQGGAGAAGSGGSAVLDAGVAGGGAAGSAGSSVGAVDLTPAGYPRCGTLDPDRADECDGIEQIVPIDPQVSSLVDGSITLGESGPVSVWVRNRGNTIRNHVCVGVVVDTPGIVLDPDFESTHPVLVGVVPAGETFGAFPSYFFVQSAEPGTTARFTTWTTYEGTNCAGPTATVEALVTEYPF